MAGVMTHMVIACEIIKRLPKNMIQDEGLLYLGALAPDAIHAREGYIRDFKKHTHLRDDIYDWDFAKDNYHSLFLRRVEEFILKNSLDDRLIDLYRGYVIHLLTDELFVLTIREEFCKRLEQLGIAQTDKEFLTYIVADMNRNDFLLVKHYDGMNDIRNKMEKVTICEVQGLLSKQEMLLSRDWMINQHFVEEHELLQPEYIRYDRMLEFIDDCVNNILGRLSEGGSLPRMF